MCYCTTDNCNKGTCECASSIGPSTTTSTEAPNVCYEKGECLYSNLLEVTYASSAQNCLKDCRDFNGCKWFTYKQNHQLCELFESCEYLTGNECGEDCITGQVSCPDEQCGLNGRCQVKI